ncbi:hypothetical protein OIU85_011747 [Salix viminalis]|uniref:Uncharacterized protein n=1 Tax=Salix viminalis TaxID=40686 RepID=A0A9Q0NTK2_SALVM|nr:hypothetical protein OIU85_011747 [Salix viminalis]
MHQKKSEVQIGKESTGISSDFSTTLNPQLLFLHHFQQQNDPITPPPSGTSPTPYKRPLLTTTTTTTTRHSQTPHRSNSLSKSPTIYHFATTHQPQSFFSVTTSVKAAAFRFLRRRLTRLKVHLRLILLLSLPFFYFLVSHPSHSFLLDFLSAFSFSAALLLSLNLALPRLPSIRLFLSRSFAINKLRNSASRSPIPVFWSIGSRSKPEKRAASGCFVQVYSNGDVYEGEFHKGKCSGSGVYYYYMSGRYEGDWVDGKYDDHGVETWARGSRYRGQYRQGLRHGFGVYRFYTGDVYAGEWSNGQTHGCGVHTCEDGSRYVGEFKWGVKHGLGHYHFRNGDTYAGEYFADKMHGFGVYHFANGHRYEGAWHEGRRQGLGMYTFRNGETQSGHWQNGILDVPSTQNTSYPVSPVAVYHSKVLNAVQEARRASEKAYDVAKVDERVNRAVAAANRAANAARVAAVKAVQKQMHPNNNNDNIPIV